MAWFDLSYLFHWFPRITIKPRRWKAVIDLSASITWPWPCKVIPPGGGVGGPGVVQTTLHQTLCTQGTVRTTFGGQGQAGPPPPRGPSLSGGWWRTATAATQVALPSGQSHGGTIWTTADSGIWKYLQKTSVRACSPKKKKLTLLTIHGSCICLISASPNENTPCKTFWLSIEKLILKLRKREPHFWSFSEATIAHSWTCFFKKAHSPTDQEFPCNEERRREASFFLCLHIRTQRSSLLTLELQQIPEARSYQLPSFFFFVLLSLLQVKLIFQHTVGNVINNTQ